MSEKVQLDLDILLPAIPDEKDRCVLKLQEMGQSLRGIEEVHLDYRNGKAVLCIHYDSEYVTLAQVERMMTQAGAQLTKRYQHETLHITNMDCADCASSIEHIVGRTEGVIDVVVNYAAEKMRVEYDSEKLSHDDIVRLVRALGYHIEEPERPRSWWQRNFELLLSLSSGVFLIAAYLGEEALAAPSSLYLSLYALAYVCGGYEAFRHGLRAALRGKFDIDFLMIVAASGAVVLGEWAEGALLLFLFSLGHALEHAAMDRAREAIKALGKLTPRTARVKRDGRELEIPVRDLQRGDIVILRPGERVPIDGVIVRGRSELDESPITGESLPRFKKKGDTVFAGAVNGPGNLEIRVTRLAKDSTLARIIQLIEEAQTQKAPSQRMVQRITRVFVPATLVAVVLVILVPPLVGWLPWQEAFFRAMSMLVAASPCALAIATPSAILAGIARAARSGVLIKGGVHLENLGGIQVMAFDKTGTLTMGRPRVTDIVTVDGQGEKSLLQIAASFESRSQHPIARAILEYAQKEHIQLQVPSHVTFLTGMGLTGELNGRHYWIGNARLFGGRPALPPTLQEAMSRFQQQGKAVLLFKEDERFIGLLALADEPRPHAAETMHELKRLGVRHLVMLTGDNEKAAHYIAEQLGLTDVYSELLPEHKVEKVRELQERHGSVAMVGDGINDAPALAAATVGIAMGGAGSDVALETADVALMSDALERLPFVVGLSRQTRKIIRQNLLLAFAVIALLLPFTFLGLASMGIAIVFHEGSTLVVVSNALRLLRYSTRA